MASQNKTITRSWKNKEGLAMFVNALLTRYDEDNTLQLTIVMRPERYEVSFVIPATDDYSLSSEKTLNSLAD